MIVTNLKSDFEELLINADQIWFAVALIKESTYDFIQDTINENCKQWYLVGTASHKLRYFLLSMDMDF